MALWTDIIDPATLTGYARASLSAYEAQKGTLAQWLPNRQVGDVVAKFVAGSFGLVDEARYRAFDAEPEVGKAPPAKRVTIELPAISQEIPVSEYQQLRERGASATDLQGAVLRTTDVVVRSIADRIERTRGVVLNTGKATIAQSNYAVEDDFGRAPGMTVTAGTLWSNNAADGLGYLQTLTDLYVTTNGVQPGSIVMSNRVLRALGALAGMQTALVGGGSRPATLDQIQATVQGAGLPPITLYNRITSAGQVIPDTQVLLLPAPVSVDDWEGTELGATFWGQTLTASDPAFGISSISDQPGIVAGVWRNDKPPMIAEVIGDALAAPVLANANLSLSAKVL